MNSTTIPCLAAALVLALAGCDRHADAPAPAPAAPAASHAALPEGGTRPPTAGLAPEQLAAATVHADRGAPPVVPAIVREGIRYEQGDAERDQGLPQASGMLVVSDDLSGKRLWTLAVYNAGVDAKATPDARSVFFKTMTFAPDGRLRIVNEDDKAFLVDVNRHTSTPAPSLSH